MLILSHLSVPECAAKPLFWKQAVLGGTGFSVASLKNTLPGIPFVMIDTPPLDGPADLCELWRTSELISSGQVGELRYSATRDLLFGSVLMSETGFDSDADLVEHSTPLQQAARAAMRDIFGVLDKLNFPHLLRVWNYFPGINLEAPNMERYQQFNAGRQEGFEACGRSLTDNVPAACALGSITGPLVVYFFAVRTPPLVIENSRQMSAYHYPKQYGARSPTFSRAVVSVLGEQDLLFISGTASILGHRTVHVGDVVAQTRESLANIAAVVLAANGVVSRSQFAMQHLCFKVYVRNPSDFACVRAELRRNVGSAAHVTFLQADICRSNLLVEIEASGGHGLETR